MKKILCYICNHLRIIATGIYSLVLIVIMFFPPISVAENGNFLTKFIFFRSDKIKIHAINSSYLFAEIVVVSLIYFAFMMFVIKKK